MSNPATKTLPDGSLRVSMEGTALYSGQVVADAYLYKIGLLLDVLSGLERTFLEAGQKATRFLIKDQDKVNPTIMDLHPVSIRKGYQVDDALDWSLEQLALVESGMAVDSAIMPSLLEKMARLPVKPDDKKISSFKLNGRADVINFDQAFEANALQLASERRSQLEGSPLFEGEVLGEVRGQLREISSIGGDRAIITPLIGPTEIECLHDATQRDRVAQFYDKYVIARGVLVYTKESPFPAQVKLDHDGLAVDEVVEAAKAARIERVTVPSLLDLRGVLAQSSV